MPDGNWVHCGEVLKETWSGELSDKYATKVSFHLLNRLQQFRFTASEIANKIQAKVDSPVHATN